MLIIDVVGNSLSANDLVLYEDTKGATHLCLIGPIMEKQGLVQLFPLPITIPFDPANPRVMHVVKCVKPPNFQKGVS